jgi:hypothetical protein
MSGDRHARTSAGMVCPLWLGGEVEEDHQVFRIMPDQMLWLEWEMEWLVQVGMVEWVGMGAV